MSCAVSPARSTCKDFAAWPNASSFMLLEDTRFEDITLLCRAKFYLWLACKVTLRLTRNVGYVLTTVVLHSNSYGGAK